MIVRRGTPVTPGREGPADIGVTNDRIRCIGDLATADAGEVIDCTGLHVLPGVIDSRVHFREPGPEWKQDLETSARSPAPGGVTAVFEMPKTEPTTTSPAMLLNKLARTRNRMDVEHAFHTPTKKRKRSGLAPPRPPGCRSSRRGCR